MKKTFLILLSLFTNFVIAQTQVSDYYDASSANRPEFSYNITVRIQKTTGATAYDTRYTATLTQASPDSKGFYNATGDKRFYTCSQLGNVCNPNNLHLISVRLSYTCNGQQKADVVVFKNLNDVQQINVVTGAGGKFCESIDFNMDVMGATLEPTHLGQIIDKINQINTPTTNQNKNNSSTINTENQSNTSTKQIPDDYKGNPLHYNNPNVSSESQDIENITTIINAATPLLQDWIDNRNKRIEEEERKKEKLEKEKLELAKLNEAKAREYYKIKYLGNYLKNAESGDEDTRMMLIAKLQIVETSCSKANDYTNFCNIQDLLPQKKEWLNQAEANNNFYALCTKASYISRENETNNIQLLEKAANLGSIDAMIILGDFYDQIPNKKNNEIYGGKNAEKAFYWYSKAAENGCPKGMYYLGMIYKYGYSRQYGSGVSPKGFNVKYDNIQKDLKTAAEWFTKSIMLKKHKESIYAQSTREQLAILELDSKWVSASIFDYEAYWELSQMYEKGIGVEKNKEIATELYQGYSTYKKLYNQSED
jgi:TPR repeat protein